MNARMQDAVKDKMMMVRMPKEGSARYAPRGPGMRRYDMLRIAALDLLIREGPPVWGFRSMSLWKIWERMKRKKRRRGCGRGTGV